MAWYSVSFGKANTGLTPVFTKFVRLDTMADISPLPSIVEIAGTGAYAFQYTPTDEPDIYFQVDGGAGLAADVRYQDALVHTNFELLTTDTTLLFDQGTALADQVSVVDTTLNQVNTKIGLPINDPGGELPKSIAYDLSLVADTVGSIQGGMNDVLSSEAATQIAVGAMQTAVEGVQTSVGGVSTSVGNMITTVGGLTSSISALSTLLGRALGMLHENSVLDKCVYTETNDLRSGRLRIYSSKDAANAAVLALPADYDTGKIAEYLIKATYSGSNLTSYLMTREFPLV